MLGSKQSTENGISIYVLRNGPDYYYQSNYLTRGYQYVTKVGTNNQFSFETILANIIGNERYNQMTDLEQIRALASVNLYVDKSVFKPNGDTYVDIFGPTLIKVFEANLTPLRDPSIYSGSRGLTDRQRTTIKEFIKRNRTANPSGRLSDHLRDSRRTDVLALLEGHGLRTSSSAPRSLGSLASYRAQKWPDRYGAKPNPTRIEFEPTRSEKLLPRSEAQERIRNRLLTSALDSSSQQQPKTSAMIISRESAPFAGLFRRDPNSNELLAVELTERSAITPSTESGIKKVSMDEFVKDLPAELISGSRLTLDLRSDPNIRASSLDASVLSIGLAVQRVHGVEQIGVMQAGKGGIGLFFEGGVRRTSGLYDSYFLVGPRKGNVRDPAGVPRIERNLSEGQTKVSMELFTEESGRTGRVKFVSKTNRLARRFVSAITSWWRRKNADVPGMTEWQIRSELADTLNKQVTSYVDSHRGLRLNEMGFAKMEVILETGIHQHWANLKRLKTKIGQNGEEGSRKL